MSHVPRLLPSYFQFINILIHAALILHDFCRFLNKWSTLINHRKGVCHEMSFFDGKRYVVLHGAKRRIHSERIWIGWILHESIPCNLPPVYAERLERTARSSDGNSLEVLWAISFAAIRVRKTEKRAATHSIHLEVVAIFVRSEKNRKMHPAVKNRKWKCLFYEALRPMFTHTAVRGQDSSERRKTVFHPDLER